MGEWFGGRGPGRRGCHFWKANTIWTTRLPAGPPITVGRNIGGGRADPRRHRPGRTTWASRRPAWPCRARRGRCGPCASCPIGMEEGTETDVPSDEIGLVVGEPAHFRFFSSSVRKDDRPGDLLSTWTPEELSETDSLEANLPADESVDEPYVPVRFQRG